IPIRIQIGLEGWVDRLESPFLGLSRALYFRARSRRKSSAMALAGDRLVAERRTGAGGAEHSGGTEGEFEEGCDTVGDSAGSAEPPCRISRRRSARGCSRFVRIRPAPPATGLGPGSPGH